MICSPMGVDKILFFHGLKTVVTILIAPDGAYFLNNFVPKLYLIQHITETSGSGASGYAARTFPSENCRGDKDLLIN